MQPLGLNETDEGALTATQPSEALSNMGSALVQQVAQRPLLMVAAAALVGFLIGQFERGRSTSSTSNRGMNIGATLSFASGSSESSSYSRPMSLQDFANRHSGS